ncbi:hypothetical protein NL676_016267 [Syzygium grande]|nr:hypothetical protein NL676_016267 [Syzygium grande]
MDKALHAASSFFDLPTEEKMKYMSNDVHKPVRYVTSLKDGSDKIQFWRVFLKHYAHPLEHWMGHWPENPPHYREKMGKFCAQVRKVTVDLMGAITEGLGLGPSAPLDFRSWTPKTAPGSRSPKSPGALQANVGDHLEALSNGLCKSVVHRAILNSERTRFSIASLHSLGMDETVEPAEELVGAQGEAVPGK